MMPDFSVAIIGAGFGGIGMAARLKRAGIGDLVLLERSEALGGTWRDNSYPGAACDVPSHLYCFSFAPNPEWSRSFSPQPDEAGRNVTLWPDFTWAFAWQTRRFDAASYDVCLPHPQ